MRHHGGMSVTAAPSPTERLRKNAARLEPPARSPGIDLARGLAVLGMFVAHLSIVTPLEWSRPDTWLGIVEGRSAILFATLAGVSLGIIASRTTGDHRRWSGLRGSIVMRAAMVWALGILLLTLEVPVFAVLPAYGVLLAAGAFMISWPTEHLVLAAVVGAITMPIVVAVIDHGGRPPAGSLGEFFFDILGWNYPFLVWLVYLTAGIIAGRVLRGGKRGALLLLTSGTALAVVGYGVVGPVGNRVVETHGGLPELFSGAWFLSVLRDHPHSQGVGEVIGSGGFALAMIGLCVLWGTTALRWPVWPVRVIGSMPLTAYTAHIVVWGVWIMVTPGVGGDVHRLHGFLALDPFWPVTLWIGAGCTVWALLMGRGPLETLVHLMSAVTHPDAESREVHGHPPEDRSSE